MEEYAQESALVGRLMDLIEPVVIDFGLDLVELQFRREAPGWVLRLILDGENGVSLDDCARLSREVSRLLEVEDPIEQSYTLEVSSPGLDRPLSRERDFSRCLGKKAKVVLREPIDGQPVFIGSIESVSQGIVTLICDQDQVPIPFNQIKRARLVIEF